jgi:hypothetical protein
VPFLLGLVCQFLFVTITLSPTFIYYFYFIATTLYLPNRNIFLNIDVWKDYRNYVNEIPFDGKSVIYEIKKCGICLVLSSDAHINEGISTNRLFEGLAAGVPLICDNHPFIKKWFGDNVFYIDTSSPDCVYNILKHIDYIKQNPNIVLQKLQQCREIFLENFVLDKQLDRLLANI